MSAISQQSNTLKSKKNFTAIFLSMLLLPLQAQELPALFKDADLKLGERLIVESKCSACHMEKVGGDGSAIYKPAGRVNAPGVLRGMVESCNTELNLGLFPEEVTAIAAVLNRDHYRYK
ncbi:MAG: hypothetical protein Q7K13_08915 [Polynucleobacter sp.]|uniref:hypothetical protein n=1 Tax=Polynucleobacter sp. TaxID=2029855 RepID=UPI002724E4C6|nr:hypothetical protein [Polynucleobacter sp.]MDO8714578.1 hypothetical protein [Polynucleobacter sp.]